MFMGTLGGRDADVAQRDFVCDVEPNEEARRYEVTIPVRHGETGKRLSVLTSLQISLSFSPE